MENVRIVEADFEEKPEDCADVTVVCGEETHHLHSRRLAHKSNFFKTALDIPMKEKEEKKIVVKEVDPTIFDCVIKYIYHGRLEFDKETQLENILHAAYRFDMEQLKDEIGNQMKEDIGKENVLDMAGLADLYNANMLLGECVKYVLKENITIKVEDVMKYPNVVIGIIDEQKNCLDIMKDKLKEVEDDIEGIELEIDEIKNSSFHSYVLSFDSMDNGWTTDDDDRSWDF